MRRFLGFVLALSTLTAAPAAQTAESLAARVPKPTVDGIAGTWRLVETRQRMANGATRPDPDLGAHPFGYMMYDSAGRMCTVFNNTDRPRWASTNPTDAETHAMFNNMLVYCGRYEVDDVRSYIIYHLEIGQSPNTVGTTRERRFELVGDSLTLYPTSASDWGCGMVD